MHFTDARAKNVFARLFSYAPRRAPDAEDGSRFRHRNALEDFCTEGLAWCLVNSKPFADRLFALDCFASLGFRPASFQADTQRSVTLEEQDEEETVKASVCGRFDLVLRSTNPTPFLIVIESKVAWDHPGNITKQINLYRQQWKGDDFNRYVEKRILLLTPFAEKHDADSHLSWDQVYDVLQTLAKLDSEPGGAIMHQFAEFLKIKQIAKMKKLPLAAALLPSLKRVAPLLAGLDGIFESLRNDELGRAVFARNSVVPKMAVNTDKGEDYLWYGIWSRGTGPMFVVGFYTTCSGEDPLSMSVQVALDGDRTSETIPDNLKKWFNKSDSGKEGERTNFIFTQEIDSTFDGNTAAVQGWIIERLRDVHAWALSL